MTGVNVTASNFLNGEVDSTSVSAEGVVGTPSQSKELLYNGVFV